MRYITSFKFILESKFLFFYLLIEIIKCKSGFYLLIKFLYTFQ